MVISGFTESTKVKPGGCENGGDFYSDERIYLLSNTAYVKIEAAKYFDTYK